MRPVLRYLVSSLVVAGAISSGGGALAAPPADLPAPEPSPVAAATASTPAAPCSSEARMSCHRRVVAWGLDCEGEGACEQSRSQEERRAYAIAASLLASAPPPPVAREEPHRGDRDGLAALVAGGLAGLAAGFAAGGRVARRRMPPREPGDGLILLSLEPARSGGD